MTPKRRTSSAKKKPARKPADSPVAEARINPRRVDALLKNWPEHDPRRVKVIEWVNQFGKCDDQVRANIRKEFGIRISLSAFSTTLTFWASQQSFSAATQRAHHRAELEEAQSGKMTVTQREEFINRSIEDELLESKEFDALLEFQKLRLKKKEHEADMKAETAKLKHRAQELDRKERELGLAIEKWEFDGAAAVLKHLDALKTIRADRSLSSDDKIAAVRLKLWGTAPEVKA